MSGARSAILAAIRTARRNEGGPPPPDAACIAREAALLRAQVAATRPDRLGGGPAHAFLERLTSNAVGATAERVSTLRDFPRAVARYLADFGLASSVAMQPHPDLLALDWHAIDIHPHIGIDEAAAVGLAVGGIAETGSLVFHSGVHSPTLFAFLPMHHIVAVEARCLWSWLEDYADAFAGHPQPRNVNLVTGPSGTTDIEGTLVRGAHGPGHLHVVLVGGETDSPSLPGASVE
jgi:L-lactate dehydrogenase complex protein LldG